MQYYCLTVLNRFMNRFYGLLFLFFTAGVAVAQVSYLPLNREIMARYEPFLDSVGSTMHTSLKPYLSNEVAANAPYDSLNLHVLKNTKFNRSLAGRKLFQEHLLEVKKNDFHLYADFIFNFSFGNEYSASKKFYANSRGIYAGGTIGRGLSFSTYFMETQQKFPDYVASYIAFAGVIPGQGTAKEFKGGGKDFAYSAAEVTYALKKYFTFQLGTGKHFIGDGYRSLLLSDIAFNYPYFKVEMNIWKIKYTCMWTAYQDLLVKPPPNMNPDDFSYRKKYSTYHYLDFNIGKKNRASIGIVEAVVWRSDSVRGTGIDFNYLNPIIFMRPVENSLSSPDNVLLGLNSKFKINSRNVLYGQVLFDEFNLKELKAREGSYANKFGFQVGIKSYHVFGIKNLRVQTEFNYVKPYTYSHRSSLTSYGHYNEPLAHVQGANFYESVNFLNYHYKQWFFQAELMLVVTGLDTAGINYGKNIFKSYTQPAQFTGNYMAQGLKTNITYLDFKIGYLLNPVYNLRIEAGITNRNATNNFGKTQNNFIYFGIKTDINNRYYDF